MFGRFAELAMAWQPSSLPILVGCGALYLTYYLLVVVKKPQLIGKDRRLIDFLYKHCPVLTEKYWPTFWCFEARANTIVRSILKTSKTVDYRREKLETADGGEVYLDWLDNDESENYSDNKTRPTVIILPGLTGDSQDKYILHMVQNVGQLGYRAVVFNNRGNGGAQLKTPRTYCATNTEDLHMVVQHIKSQYPNGPLIAVGVSLGGMILFHYIAKTGKDCQLRAGMVISTAWNVFKTTESLESTVNYLVFNQFLTGLLRNAVQRHIRMFESHFDIDHVMQSRTIRDFDERVTAKMFGYDSVEHYYTEATLSDKLDAVKIPVLCLTAADDPFSPKSALPLAEAKQHPNIVFAVTSHGGHIGFCEGLLPRHKSYMDRVMIQYIDAIFKHSDEELDYDEF